MSLSRFWNPGVFIAGSDGSSFLGESVAVYDVGLQAGLQTHLEKGTGSTVHLLLARFYETYCFRVTEHLVWGFMFNNTFMMVWLSKWILDVLVFCIFAFICCTEILGWSLLCKNMIEYRRH